MFQGESVGTLRLTASLEGHRRRTIVSRSVTVPAQAIRRRCGRPDRTGRDGGCTVQLCLPPAQGASQTATRRRDITGRVLQGVEDMGFPGALSRDDACLVSAIPAL
jgi:hypothetical protein